MRFLIHTYGCQMNVRDSEAVEALLIEAGHVKAASEEEAELVIVNSCTVRQKAEEKAIGKAGNLIADGKIVGMMGCAVKRLGPALAKKLPKLAFAVAPGELLKIPYVQGGDPLAAHTDTGFKAFVTVMTGCDNCCSYCIVPTVRGHEYSRPADEIVREVECLAARGVKEVTLLGQSVLRYKGFPQLLRRIQEIDVVIQFGNGVIPITSCRLDDLTIKIGKEPDDFRKAFAAVPAKSLKRSELDCLRNAVWPFLGRLELLHQRKHATLVIRIQRLLQLTVEGLHLFGQFLLFLEIQINGRLDVFRLSGQGDLLRPVSQLPCPRCQLLFSDLPDAPQLLPVGRLARIPSPERQPAQSDDDGRCRNCQ